MSKKIQNQKAQKIKKELKKLGLTMNMKVSQEIGCETVCIQISNGLWNEVDDGFIVFLDECGEIERLTYEEYTTIIDYPTEQEIVNYLKGVK